MNYELKNNSSIERSRNIPQVRFPEFKDSWEHKQLNELLSVSKTKNTDLKYGKEDVLSVSGELGIVNQIEHLGRSYARVSVHNYGVVELNQIVYTKSPLKANPYGIIKLNKHKAGIVSTLYAVYNVNQETDGQFIEYYFSLDANLNRYLRPLVRKGAKNDMKISNEYVLNDRVFSPQLPEQKKIAHFFTTIDQKINQLQEKKNALEGYKKGMMQQIFAVGEKSITNKSITNYELENNELDTAKTRNSSFVIPNYIRFKDENGNEFPDWEVKKLGEVCEIVGGGTPDTTKQEYWGDTYNWFTPTEIKSDFVYASKRRITKLGLQKSSAKILPIGTILLTTRATIGEVAIAKEECTTNQGFQSLIVNKSNDTVFIFNWIKRNKYELMKRANGSTFPEVSKKEILKIPIPSPCKSEQTKIANFLSKIDEKIENVNQQITKTKEWKKGLLQKMFV